MPRSRRRAASHDVARAISGHGKDVLMDWIWIADGAAVVVELVLYRQVRAGMARAPRFNETRS